MNKQEFSDHLALRHDGFWELLATAVGHDVALQRTVSALDGTAFKLGIGQIAGTPSLVQMRVEALATADVLRLVNLSKSWTKPANMTPDLLSAEHDLLHAAWHSSLRFLVPRHAVSLQELNTQNVGIRQEVEILFPPAIEDTIEWEDLVDGFAAGRTQYADVRRLDGRALSLATIGKRELRDLMLRGSDNQPQFARLRILRGRHERLTPEAIGFLCECLRDASSEHVHWASLAVAAEIAISVSSAIHSELMARTVESLRSGEDPRELAPLAYVLLGSGWLPP